MGFASWPVIRTEEVLQCAQPIVNQEIPLQTSRNAVAAEDGESCGQSHGQALPTEAYTDLRTQRGASLPTRPISQLDLRERGLYIQLGVVLGSRQLLKQKRISPWRELGTRYLLSRYLFTGLRLWHKCTLPSGLGARKRLARMVLSASGQMPSP